jgi:small subunit ribosomal protein S17
MTGATPTVQAQRKTKVGRVVSDRMDKTIVVSVERLARHRLYKRVIRLTTKFKAHDEANEAHIGDTVLIEESRPLSATKRWRLVRIVTKAGEHGLPSEIVAEIAEEVETSEAIHAAAHPGRVAKAEAEQAESEAEAEAEAEAAATGEAAEAADAAEGGKP